MISLTTLEIRAILFEKQEHKCKWCDKLLSWSQCHMHEQIFRGKGGEISLDNSVILCADCHILNPRQTGAHGSRQPRFKGRK
jgi:hypothetical protein